ncbi:MAG: class I SAM-dependent methyltransferase [candidate division KSB1 bacterium]|nr:class I SAM-dependent methyltransferase [candidate division KSB1 bacterium]
MGVKQGVYDGNATSYACPSCSVRERLLTGHDRHEGYEVPLKQILDRWVQPGHGVLGTRRWVFCPVREGATCFGVDFLAKATAEAYGQTSRTRAENFVLQRDAAQPPLFRGALDAIVSFGLLGHIRDHVPVLCGRYDLLKSGGVAILSVPNARRWAWFVSSALR